MRNHLALSLVFVALAGLSQARADDSSDELFFRPEPPLSCLGEQACIAVPPEQAGVENQAAFSVLEQFANLPEEEKRYFLGQLSGARGFAVFPNVQKQGMMMSTYFSHGLMSYKDDDGRWSPPILLTIQGQSLGPHFGAQSSNVMFVFKTICGVKDFLAGHHHLSSSGLGTTVEHVGDTGPSEPLGITVHVFEHGAMIGQSYDRYVIHIDEAANAALYGVVLKPGCIVEGVRYGLRRPWLQEYFERLGQPEDKPHHSIELTNQPVPSYKLPAPAVPPR